jgi:hypothetical protein
VYIYMQVVDVIILACGQERCDLSLRNFNVK